MILSILVGVVTKPLVPSIVRMLEPPLPGQSFLLQLLLRVFIAAVLGSCLVGLIGMFIFWSLSRYIYLVAVFLKILASPLMASWMVETGWESLFEELELFLDGAILTLCLLGPAKHLFEKKEE